MNPELRPYKMEGKKAVEHAQKMEFRPKEISKPDTACTTSFGATAEAQKVSLVAVVEEDLRRNQPTTCLVVDMPVVAFVNAVE